MGFGQELRRTPEYYSLPFPRGGLGWGWFIVNHPHPKPSPLKGEGIIGLDGFLKHWRAVLSFTTAFAFVFFKILLTQTNIHGSDFHQLIIIDKG